ncbi:MAG: putative Ig domain-containing protein, partial [Steroidobacter sp.]
MVAIVSGQSLGLFNTSANILGSGGIFGQGRLGQADGRAYVNVANGNLVLQFRDELLSGRGSDLQHTRTYNSLGSITDGDEDGWRWQGERTVRFDAERNQVTRTGSDGSQTVYAWNGDRYVSTDGDGAHDSIRRDGAQWVWTDGSSRLEERYNDSGRLVTQKDASGNVIEFVYDGARLIRVRDQGSQQRIELIYGQVNGGYTRLLRVETYELTVDGTGRAQSTLSTSPIRQVEYTYNNGRLETVKTVLDPSASPLQYYTTTYTYETSSPTDRRVTSIIQSDGTRVEFTYDSQGRIKTVRDGQGLQEFIYGTNTTSVQITDAPGPNARTRVWTYSYDTRGQLERVDAPSSSGGAAVTTRFEYDSDGNVSTVIDSLGNEVEYHYDARGNRIRESDALGQVHTRTFNDQNQVVTESRFRTAGQNSAEALTIRYVYDSQSRLRFTISAEGRVQEYRYGTGTGEYGLLTRSIQYTQGRYNLGALGVGEAPDEATLTTWVGTQNRASTQLTQYTYDFRGNLTTRTDFATVNATTGEGVLDTGAVITDSIYDGHGNLLQTIARRGAHRNDSTIITSFTYDGLGRLIGETSAGVRRTTAYDGSARTIRVTNLDSRMEELRAYDIHGRLVSVQLSAIEATSADPAPRVTQNVYDGFGQLRLVQDALGNRHFNFYDALGRLVQQVDRTGAVCSYEYDANGHLVSQKHYAQRVSAEAMNSWVSVSGGEVTSVTKSLLTIGSSNTDVITGPADRVTNYAYDAAGRLTNKVEAGLTTTTVYDAVSRVIELHQSGERGQTRTQRYFYDKDNLRIGSVDALGYLTEYKYDAGKRLTDTIRYSTRSPAMADLSTPTWVGVSDQTATGGKPFEYALRAVDADGDALTYQLVSGPNWLTLDTSVASRPVLRGTAPQAQSAPETVIVRANDGRGHTSEVTIRITIGNGAPTWVALPDMTVASGTPNFQLTLPAAADADGSTLTYSMNTAVLPPGLSFNAGSPPTISGTPTTPGTYAITVRVTDAGTPPLFTERTFILQVTNRGPSWSAPVTVVSGMRGQQFSFVLPPALDPEGQGLTYRIAHGPSWLSIDSNTRTVSGTPPLSMGITGPRPAVVVEAQDANGETVRLAFFLQIQNAPPTWPQTLPSPPALHAGSFFRYDIPAAVDPEGNPIEYRVFNLPPGLSLSGRTISGQSSSIGTFVLMLVADDQDGGVISRQITLTQTNSAPVYQQFIETFQLHLGEWWDWNVPPAAFSDADGDPIVYTLHASTQLPAGIEFVSHGPGGGAAFRARNWSAPILSVISITVVATDVLPNGALGQSSTRTFGIVVMPVPRPIPPEGVPELTGDVELPSIPQIEAQLEPFEDVLAQWRPTNMDGLRLRSFYDGLGRLIGSVDEQGFLTEFVHDVATNRQHSVRYANALTVGNDDTLATLKARAGAGRTATLQFDQFGRVSTSTATDGTVTRSEYDDAGRLVRTTTADGTNEARARRTRYNVFGEVTGALGGVGDAWLAADNSRTLAQAIDRFGVRYEYDAAGRQVLAIGANGVDGNGNRTRFFYDAEGHLTHTLNARGEVSETRYNAFGEIASTRGYNTRFDTSGSTFLGLMSGTIAQLPTILLTLLDASADRLVSYEYDRRGHVTKITDPMQFTTQNTYTDFGELETLTRLIRAADGSVPASTVTTRFGYSLRGDLLSTTRDVGGLNDHTQTRYDAFGRVIASVNGAGRVTTTRYEDSGRTIVITDPLNRSIRTEYDAFARVLKAIDARGQATTYNYNDDARSLTVTTPEGVQVTTFTSRHGETLRVIDGRGNTTSYDYDRDGHLAKVSHTETSRFNAQTQVQSENSYDDAGHLIETKDARGIVTRFRYDAVNRLISRQVDPDGLNLTTTYT